MKVLQINALARTKSTGRTVYEMHQELLDRNIESCVAVSYYGKTEEQYGQYVIGTKGEARVHALLSRLTGLQGYYSNTTTEKVITYIEHEKPSVVVLRVLHNNFINVNKLMLYLKKKNIPTILVLHDLWFCTGHCVYPIYTECEKYKTICSHCSQKKKANRSWLFDRSSKIWRDRKALYAGWKNLAVVGVSQWATECARESSVMNGIKLFSTIYNWIDLQKFQIEKVEKQNPVFTILGVCSEWGSEKGVEDFIKLSWMLENEELVLVGRMSEKYRLQFPPKKVRFIDFVTSEKQLAELYNQADVYVTMSKAETFGKTTAEALSCGTPCIVYDVGASPELIGERCGYVAAPGDVKSVYACIQKVQGMGKDYYTNACREWACEHFSKCKNIEKYIDLFHQLI